MAYEYMISFILAFIVAFCATPIARKLAYRLGAIDVPKDERRMHSKPIPRLGGLAIVAGFMVSVLFNAFSTPFIFKLDQRLLGMLAGIGIIEVMGVLDDIKPLRSRTKLAFQIMAAAAAILISDIRIREISNPFSEVGYAILPDWLSYALTALWIVGITNAVNLIDGLDGLAAGVTSISSLSLFFISVLRPDQNLDIVYTAFITITLAGATLGFLPYNYNPAKIFMAESGSAFLGFVLGVISIQGTIKSYATISIAIPMLVLGLPLFDTTFAILRRLISGKPIMQADRGHLHHRLIDMGLSHKQSVVVIYTASAGLGLCAIVLADRGPLSAIMLLIALAVFMIGGAKYMSEISKEEDSPHMPVEYQASQEEAEDQQKDKSGNPKEDEGPTQINISEMKNLENT